MRRLFYMCLCVLGVCLTACKDNNEEPGPKTEDEQYLVMLYGVGGGNLDYYIMRNVLQALEVGSSDKVKMTFQYRFSEIYQQLEGEEYEYTQNVRRFDADENTHLKGAYDATDETLNEEEVIEKYYSSIHSTVIGNADYVMACDTALTSFVKWSKAKHPKATKTVLIINDHGGGWNLYLDGYKDTKKESTSRSILADDNTTDPNLEDITMSLSVGDIKRALTEAGGVDVLYTDACLMATWENLTGYAYGARYFLGSLETAPARGGNYHYLINRLTESEVTDEGMEKALRGYIDDIIDIWWNDSKMKVKIYGDMNLYNLQKIDAPLNLMKEITQTLAEKWQSETPIPGIPATAELGDKWKNYIRPAVTRCISATASLSAFVVASVVPKPLRDFMESKGINLITNNGHEGYYANSVLWALKVADMEQLDPNEEYKEAYLNLWKGLQTKTTDSYCFADFLCTIAGYLQDEGLDDDNNPILDYQQQYIEAIKEMGYIRCTHPLPDYVADVYGMIDYTYNCCSPGIFIYSFDKTVYEKNANFTYRWATVIPDVNEALKCYQSTDFDKKTSWSSLLRLFDQIPSITSNPAREEYEWE